MNKKDIFSKGIDSFTLHILAMAFMVADHLWNIFFPNQIWLNVLGRLAFPIFAFMLVEGFFRTKNRKKYLIRIFIFAAISEIPFNLFASLALRGEIMVFYPYNNVLWIFGIALCGMNLLEKVEKSENLNKIIKFFAKAVISILTAIIAHFARSDYLEYGIITILIFYFFREKNYRNIIFQALLMVFLNIFIMPGLELPFNFFGNEIFIKTQIFTIFSLPIIWLYNGKQGIHNKFTKYMFYFFYPLHLLLIVAIYVSFMIYLISLIGKNYGN